MSVFGKKPEKERKTRYIQDDRIKPRSLANISQEDEALSGSKKVFDELKENINLGNELLDLLDEKCKASHIPVPEELQNIRAAVSRKDPLEPEGARISFELFLLGVKKYEAIKLEYRLMVSQTLAYSENHEISNTLKTKLKKKTLAGINPDDILLFTSLWFLNYMESKYQQVFTLSDITSIASAHSEGAGPAAVGAAKLGIAFAFAAALDVIYDNLGRKVPRSSIQTEGETLSEGEARLEELAIKKIGENDFDIIIDYVVKYISASKDSRYGPWISYLSTRQARNASIDAYSYYPSYSSQTFLKTNNAFSDGNEDFVENSKGEEFMESLKNQLQTNFTGILESSGTHLRNISAESKVTLQTSAQISSYRLTKDQICCFVRIMTMNKSIDRKHLKLFKGLVNIYSNTLSVDVYETFANKLINNIKKIDIGQMMSIYVSDMLNNILNKMYNDYLKQFNDFEVNKMLEKCTLYMNFLNTLLNLADDLVFKTSLKLSKEAGKDRRVLKDWSRSLESKYEVRMLDDLELIYASMLQRSLQECALIEDDIATDIINEFVTGFDLPSNQYTIDISDEMQNKYFSESQPIRLSRKTGRLGIQSEIRIPPVRKIGDLETSEEVIRNILRTCKIDISDDQIKQMLKDTDGSSR